MTIKLLITREGTQDEYICLRYGELKQWLRLYHIALIVELYKKYGEYISVEGNTNSKGVATDVYMHFKNKAMSKLMSIMKLNSRRSKYYYKKLKEEDRVDIDNDWYEVTAIEQALDNK